MFDSSVPLILKINKHKTELILQIFKESENKLKASCKGQYPSFHLKLWITQHL